MKYSLKRKFHIKANVPDGATLPWKPFFPLKRPLWFDLFHFPEALLCWVEQEWLALAFAALMVVSHSCVGRSQPVTHAYLWGMQQLKHGLTNPHECTVTSEHFQQMLPVTSLSTAWRISLAEWTGRHTRAFIKRSMGECDNCKASCWNSYNWWGIKFPQSKTCLLPPEKSLSIFKVTLIWNMPHAELPHAFRITSPCCFFKHYKRNK